jgi:hypothetical protein
VRVPQDAAQRVEPAGPQRVPGGLEEERSVYASIPSAWTVTMVERPSGGWVPVVLTVLLLVLDELVLGLTAASAASSSASQGRSPIRPTDTAAAGPGRGPGQRHRPPRGADEARRHTRFEQGLSTALLGDEEHCVTVRAEISRLRRVVGGLVTANPYRLATGVRLSVVPPAEASPRSEVGHGESPGGSHATHASARPVASRRVRT